MKSSYAAKQAATVVLNEELEQPNKGYLYHCQMISLVLLKGSFGC